MFNPLLENIGKIKDEELENKILDLTKKYFIAAKLGQGSLCEQIALNLDVYKEEQYKRQIENTKSVLKKQDKDLDDLINVE